MGSNNTRFALHRQSSSLWDEKMGARGKLDSTSPKLLRVCKSLCPAELADGLNPPWDTKAQFNTDLGLLIQKTVFPRK